MWWIDFLKLEIQLQIIQDTLLSTQCCISCVCLMEVFATSAQSAGELIHELELIPNLLPDRRNSKWWFVWKVWFDED